MKFNKCFSFSKNFTLCRIIDKGSKYAKDLTIQTINRFRWFFLLTSNDLTQEQAHAENIHLIGYKNSIERIFSYITIGNCTRHPDNIIFIQFYAHDLKFELFFFNFKFVYNFQLSHKLFTLLISFKSAVHHFEYLRIDDLINVLS